MLSGLVKITIRRGIKQMNCGPLPRENCLMRQVFRFVAFLFTQPSCSRRELLLENLALRQKLAVLRRNRPRPRLAASDGLFRVLLRRLRSGWRRALIFVQPETVVRAHKSPSASAIGCLKSGTWWAVRDSNPRLPACKAALYSAIFHQGPSVYITLFNTFASVIFNALTGNSVNNCLKQWN